MSRSVLANKFYNIFAAGYDWRRERERKEKTQQGCQVEEEETKIERKELSSCWQFIEFIQYGCWKNCFICQFFNFKIKESSIDFEKFGSSVLSLALNELKLKNSPGFSKHNLPKLYNWHLISTNNLCNRWNVVRSKLELAQVVVVFDNYFIWSKAE